jgi:hypothetical protein
MPNILVTESQGFSPEAAALLAQLGSVVWGDMDRPTLLAAVAQVEILWIRLRHRIDAEVLAAAPAHHCYAYYGTQSYRSGGGSPAGYSCSLAAR